MERLKIDRLTLSYGNKTIIKNLSLTLHDGELFSLLGPSGAGKTTLLKAVAGLLPVHSGEIFINGSAINHLPAEHRDVVLIFQKPLLFPFLNVRDNIAFGLRMQKFKTTEVESRVARMTELTELRGLASRKIHELSGGQQQRVALARGLILAPSVLLLDEPFSNLDATLRQQMRELLKRLQQETGTTMLFVTHDQGEAFSISDRIGLVLDGSIRQLGQPDALFYRPMDIKVARFFGIQNILRGNIVDGIFHSDLIECHTNLDNGPAVAIIRPEDIHHSQQPIENGIPGIITAKQFEGTVTKLTILVGQQTIQLTVLRNEYTIGQELWLHFPEDRIQINYDISF